ncbi:MAG: hypothetical protein NVS4B11_26420 [Ktedonobacteraceae bacterium]
MKLADNGGSPLRPGIDLLLTTQVARMYYVHERTVLRWIQKEKLPAKLATREQIAELVRDGYLGSIPPYGAYLIRESDLDKIPSIRALRGRPREE